MNFETNVCHVQQPKKRLSLLLTTNHLLGWTGSETLLLTLIEGLLQAGCAIAVYARHWNQEWVDAYFDPCVQLTDDLKTFRNISFDMAHVQHNACLIDVRSIFPTLPLLFSSLGVKPFLEQPVPFDLCVSRFLAISEEVAANLVQYGTPKHRIHIVRNLVSGRRFSPSSPIREKLQRILVISYKIDVARKSRLCDAAARIGASIRFVGSTGDAIPQDHLGMLINEADVVVSLGRGVVEAMLCGRVPLVFDIHGGDGLVTPENFEEISTSNFSGRCYRRDFSVNDLVMEFGKYRKVYGDLLRDMATHQFGVEQNITRLLEIYRCVVAESASPLLPNPMPAVLGFCSAMAHEDILLSRQHQQMVLILQTEINRIRGTISWRITAPLRVAWNFYKKLFC